MISQVGSTSTAGPVSLAGPSSGVVSVIISKPTGVALGDLLIFNWFGNYLQLESSQNPSGWTFLTNQNVSSTQQEIYWKVAGSSEPSTYTFKSFFSSPSGGQTFAAGGSMTAWRGLGTSAGFFVTFNKTFAQASIGSPNAALTTNTVAAGTVLTSFLCDPVVFAPADGTGGFDGGINRGTKMFAFNDPPLEPMLVGESLVQPSSYTISAHIGPVSPQPWWNVITIVLGEPTLFWSD